MPAFCLVRTDYHGACRVPLVCHPWMPRCSHQANGPALRDAAPGGGA